MASDEATGASLATKYRNGLLDDVLPFWLKHSLDREHGGYFSCLDQKGSVYDTDKFMWLQGREAWMFSALYNRLEKRAEWLDAARVGIEFLKSHGRDERGNWYFQLDRVGRPISKPWSIFSDCFISIAFAQYALAGGDEESREIAVQTYENIWRCKDDPSRGLGTDVGDHRSLLGFSLPMILINMCLEFEDVLSRKRLEADARVAVHELMDLLLDRKTMLLHEAVAPDGSLVDCLEGRRINPGHGAEAMWFVMTVSEKLGDGAMIDLAARTALRQIEFGWDKEYGGIYAFLDEKGYPPEQLEWDQKLWWAHLESIVTMLMAYRHTREPQYWEWFERLHDYSWRYFADPEFGEWWGYLNRRGEVSLALKGGKWKGCFHVPRGLWMAWKELEALA